MKGLCRLFRNNQQKQFWILLELIIILVLALIRSPLLTIVILLFCLLRLLGRIISWEDLGFIKGRNILSALATGFLIALLYQAFSIFLFVPIIQSITNSRIDLSEIIALKADWFNLVIALLISWTFAAFGEELAYRSYVFTQISGLFTNRRMGSVIGVLVCTALFAVGHGYQGISGVIENALFGLTMALIFIVSKRNLWLPVIAHGFVDTIGFVLIFTGLYP
jgi:membrane protease YdiL (CAAX protease family)